LSEAKGKGVIMKKRILTGFLTAAILLASLPIPNISVLGAELSAVESVDADLEALLIPDSDEVRGNLHLPLIGDSGSTIQWTSSNSAVVTDKAGGTDGEIPAGIVIRQDQDTDVTLSATVSKDSVSKTKEFTATVLARPQEQELEAYLFAYFPYTDQKKDERIYFATSLNGLDYQAVNAGEFIIESRLGTHGLRDPFVIRSPEGDKFYMIATDLTVAGVTQDGIKYPGMNWDKNQTIGSKSIMVWESTNLVDWTNQRMCEVAVPTAGCTWAPEAYWDETTGEFIVFWASRVSDDNFAKQRIYYTKTRDFYNFTPAQVWINESWNAIDTTVIKEGEYYYRFTKNEDNTTNENGTPGKRIYGERSASMLGDWELVNPNALNYSSGQIEGPCIFKFNNRDSEGEDKWCLMADATGKAIIPGISTDLAGGDPTFTIASATMPVPAASHGTVIPITAEEYDAVMMKWDETYAAAPEGEETVIAVAEAADAITLPSKTMENLTLPTVGENDTKITWYSDMPEVISADGTVTLPKFDQKDVVVTLTAVVKGEYRYNSQESIGFKVEKREFQVTVKKAPSYTVVLSPNGGTVSETSIIVEVGAEINNLPIPAKSNGDKFKGWYDAPTNGNLITLPYKPTKSMTIYAQWTPANVRVNKVAFGNTKGKTIQIKGVYTRKATVSPATATNTTLVYTSSNPKVATVDASTGKVTGIAAGKTIITAKSTDGSGKSASYTVYVNPGKVKGLKVNSKKKNTATVKWNKVKGADGYEVIWSKSSNKKWSKAKKVSKNRNSFTKTGLSGGKRFYFKVRAYKKIGNKTLYGAYSKTVNKRVK